MAEKPDKPPRIDLHLESLNLALSDAVHRFHGYAPTLESAIGALVVGKIMGWEVLYLIHNRSTIKKFEQILDLRFKDHMPPNTEQSRKHYWWAWSNKFKSFWKIVRGDIRVEGRTEIARDLVDESKLKNDKAITENGSGRET